MSGKQGSDPGTKTAPSAQVLSDISESQPRPEGPTCSQPVGHSPCEGLHIRYSVHLIFTLRSISVVKLQL